MIGHIFFGIFVLILFFLVLSNWQAANALVGTGGSTLNAYTRTLQGRAA